MSLPNLFLRRTCGTILSGIWSYFCSHIVPPAPSLLLHKSLSNSSCDFIVPSCIQLCVQAPSTRTHLPLHMSSVPSHFWFHIYPCNFWTSSDSPKSPNLHWRSGNGCRNSPPTIQGNIVNHLASDWWWWTPIRIS